VSEPLTQKVRVWRVRVLAATWLSYAGFYFCRKNYSIAKSTLLDTLDITKTEIAHVFTAYLVAYMLGQFLTSYLGRKTALRTLLLGGMGLSLVCNIAFGFDTMLGPAGYWPLVLFMVLNGFAQATGWAGNVGILGNWLRRKERGRYMAIWATCYQIGSVMAKTFASFMLAIGGALWSFWGAAIVLFAVWIFFYFYGKDRPEDVGLDPMIEEVEVEVPVLGPGEVREKTYFGWTRTTALSVLFMGLAYFVFKFLRYALDSWSPLAIEEIFLIQAAEAGFVSTAFDWVGFLGVLAGGFISDRFFQGRRYQTVVIMTIGMLGAFIFLATIGVTSIWMFAVGLSLCGFMLMGPDSLLSGVGAIDVGGKSQAVVAAGIINGLGSIGPIFQEELIGRIVDDHGHQASFYLLIGVALAGVFATLYLAHRSRKGLSTL
jgi:MFS transporter, OPA family, sugar phosphate sensor protein UhpC